MTRLPRETTRLFGHDEARHALDHAWTSGHIHHAWLLTGASGVGKATLAFRTARMVLGGLDPQAAARRVAAATHPDLLVVARTADEKRQRLRAEIVLEDVRPVAAFLRRTAAEDGWRVVIIDGADHLNRNAANALLKLLEEPPAKALILMTCTAPGMLLPTLRSRCRMLRLAPLDGATMQAALRDLLPDMSAVDRQVLVELGGGSPGHALQMAAEGGVALRGLVQDVLAAPGRGALWPYELADAVLRAEHGFSTFISLLAAAISATIRSKVRGPGGAETNLRLASRTPAAWAAICDELARLRDETETLNLDKRQALLAGLSLLSGS